MKYLMILLVLSSLSCASYNEDTEETVHVSQEVFSQTVPDDYVSPQKMFDIAYDRITTGDSYKVIAERHNIKYETLLTILNTERYQKRYRKAKEKVKKEMIKRIPFFQDD